jgi:hypothetical protein
VNKRARIGDVCEIRTPAGLAYVQCTHDGLSMGQLVRVLPGLYSSRPNMAKLVKDKELYFVFYTLDAAIKAGGALIVGNEPVPDWAKSYPLMRKHGARDRDGRTLTWKIVDASTPFTPDVLRQTPNVSLLTPEQQRLSIFSLWPHPVMVKELARGWTPARSEEFRLRDVAEDEAQNGQDSPKIVRLSESMRHYLYFPQKFNAEKAGQWFRSRGLSVEVRRGADGKNWLALVMHKPFKTEEEMNKLRGEMEALASELEGEYDGWELAV